MQWAPTCLPCIPEFNVQHKEKQTQGRVGVILKAERENIQMNPMLATSQD